MTYELLYSTSMLRKPFRVHRFGRFHALKLPPAQPEEALGIVLCHCAMAEVVPAEFGCLEISGELLDVPVHYAGKLGGPG